MQGMIYDCPPERGQAGKVVYMYARRKSGRGGRPGKAKSDGKCGRAATMTKETSLNCSQVREILREGEEEVTTFVNKG